VVVTRLDRLARSTTDLLTIVKQIADRGCLFTSLADPWCDSTTPAQELWKVARARDRAGAAATGI
jgi:DNA invertase Pin-like site-specific DNA recombinase